MENVKRKKELVEAMAHNLSEMMSLKEDNKAILESASAANLNPKEIAFHAKLRAEAKYEEEQEKALEKQEQLKAYLALFPHN